MKYRITIIAMVCALNSCSSITATKEDGGTILIAKRGSALKTFPEDTRISGAVADELGNIHNGGIARDYSVSGILSVWDVKRNVDVITVKFWEIPGPLETLDVSTISTSDFLINGGAITFSGLNVTNYEVEFTADTPLTGNEIITISGDIKDDAGNLHNYGVEIIHTFR